jgi:WhiB family redox-sensing transcriptional regulator
MMPNWAWQGDAACRGEDLVLFFGPDGERQPERAVRERKAKAICSGCPVRNACLNYALDRPEKYGTWGGLNEDERASERRRRFRRPVPPKPVVAVGEKRCSVCQLVQPATAFGSDKQAKGGLNASCRECTNEAARRRRREAKQAVVA